MTSTSIHWYASFMTWKKPNVSIKRKWRPKSTIHGMPYCLPTKRNPTYQPIYPLFIFRHHSHHHHLPHPIHSTHRYPRSIKIECRWRRTGFLVGTCSYRNFSSITRRYSDVFHPLCMWQGTRYRPLDHCNHHRHIPDIRVGGTFVPRCTPNMMIMVPILPRRMINGSSTGDSSVAWSVLRQRLFSVTTRTRRWSFRIQRARFANESR